MLIGSASCCCYTKAINLLTQKLKRTSLMTRVQLVIDSVQVILIVYECVHKYWRLKRRYLVQSNNQALYKIISFNNKHCSDTFTINICIAVRADKGFVQKYTPTKHYICKHTHAIIQSVKHRGSSAFIKPIIWEECDLSKKSLKLSTQIHCLAHLKCILSDFS